MRRVILRTMSIEAYLDAAANKIALARDHYADLDALREGAEHERRQVQSAFEGVIGNGISAGDQAAAALGAAAGVDLGRRNTPEELLRALARADRQPVDELAACISALRAWADEPVVRDARERRNLAVHAHYEKRPYKLRLTWLLDEVFVRGRSSPYHGALEIHSYCEAFVGSLAHLERVIDCVRSQPD
jgi:hypothetical protein